MKKKVVVTDASYPHLRRERAAATRCGAQFTAAKSKSSAELLKVVRGADVVLVQYSLITDRVLAQLNSDALVIRYGIGLDNIDLQAAKRRGIRVAHVPDYATSEVADHTAALILAMLRRIIPLDRSVREGGWAAESFCRWIIPFAELRIGYLGFGRIGQQVHARLKAFGFKAAFCDPELQVTHLGELGAQQVELDELFGSSDVITLHAPLTGRTRHVINARSLAYMRQRAVLINTARGGLVDTAALEEALLNKTIAGAALDVFDEEPLPMASKLRTLPNVILTPHAAWCSRQSIANIQSFAAEEVERALRGQPARCPVLPAQ